MENKKRTRLEQMAEKWRDDYCDAGISAMGAPNVHDALYEGYLAGARDMREMAAAEAAAQSIEQSAHMGFSERARASWAKHMGNEIRSLGEEPVDE